MFYRTTYTVQVLSPEPIPPDVSFPDAVREGMVGTYVLDIKRTGVEILERRQMSRALVRAGTHPGFFDLPEYQLQKESYGPHRS